MAGRISGAIDLGGTKIEARLFDAGFATLDRRRLPTPTQDFGALIEAVAAQVAWLEGLGGAALPIGISIAGVIDPDTGRATAANLPVTGRDLGHALRGRLGRDLPLMNDCTAFAWSEAHGGAGQGARSVLGLVLGTGVGAGMVLDGRPMHRASGLAVEIGHMGVPARGLARHGLPLWDCGCGRAGCYENYVSGPGLARIAAWAGIAQTDPAALAGDPAAAPALSIWIDLAAEMLYDAQVMLDPQVIVLGGGLSNMAGIADRLAKALDGRRLGGVRAPDLRLAQHGDSSGARGAALMACGVGPC